MIKWDFTDKVAIVTGSSSGIGRVTALQLASGGAAVCVVSDKNVAGGKDTARKIAEAGGKSIFVQADVSTAAGCQKIAAETRGAFSRIDILVNNAGITRRKFLPDMDEVFWDTVLNTNLKSAYMLSREVIGDMLARNAGSVINVSSVHAFATHGGMSAYAASKAGLGGFTRALALEFGARGVRFNCVAPGSVDNSEHPSEHHNPQWTAKWALEAQTAQPSKRLGKPDEIASLICFLASEQASFINGATFTADGALLCKLGAS